MGHRRFLLKWHSTVLVPSACLFPLHFDLSQLHGACDAVILYEILHLLPAKNRKLLLREVHGEGQQLVPRDDRGLRASEAHRIRMCALTDRVKHVSGWRHDNAMTIRGHQRAPLKVGTIEGSVGCSVGW